MQALLSHISITVTKGGMFTFLAAVAIVFVVASILFVIEWHRYGFASKKMVVGESVYTITAAVLFGIAVLSIIIF